MLRPKFVISKKNRFLILWCACLLALKEKEEDRIASDKVLRKGGKVAAGSSLKMISITFVLHACTLQPHRVNANKISGNLSTLKCAELYFLGWNERSAVVWLWHRLPNIMSTMMVPMIGGVLTHKRGSTQFLACSGDFSSFHLTASMLLLLSQTDRKSWLYRWLAKWHKFVRWSDRANEERKAAPHKMDRQSIINF